MSLRQCLPLLALLLVVPAAISQVDPPAGAFAPLRYGDPDDPTGAAPFFPGATHDEQLLAPEDVLGQPLGSRLAHHAEILRCFRAWDEQSPRVSLRTHGETYEGRPLVHAVITSPANHARLDDIQAALGRLADPRGLMDADALLASTPPVAWLGYSIHGDELSGADASLAVAHHLVASTDADVAELLDQVVVVIDPCMNPDGRQRILGMVEQSTGYVPNLDYDSMQRGRWPWGRGNHYLFDLNRDWMTGVHPETRGRWAAAGAFHPQIFVDAHEMGSLDSFLFYPQAAPYNPFLPPRLEHWQRIFGNDQGAAFDAYGWPYYTREWADAWGPYYSDAWASLGGAIGILYEQAATYGFPLRQATGNVLTYREAVHHQAASSLANLRTLAAHRDGVLADYLASRRANVDPEAPGNDRMLAVVTGRNPARERALLDLLRGQGIEVFGTNAALQVADAVSTLGDRHDVLDLPEGTWLVPARQPEGPRVRSYLAFDIRLDDESLLREREDLEKEGETRLYDVTAWSLPLLFDLEAYWCDVGEDGVAGTEVRAAHEPVELGLGSFQKLKAVAGGVTMNVDRGLLAEPFGWVVNGDDDASVTFASRALQDGLVVHLSDEPFETAGRTFPRGSLLVRRIENGDDAQERVDAAARAAGVLAYATASGRAPGDGPDLGGGHFHLLQEPRVAILSNAPVAPDTFGHLWYLMDRQLGLPVSFLDAQHLGGADLRRFNVLVLPPAWTGLGQLLTDHAGTLRDWVADGGTLVACGGAAAAVTSADLELSSVRQLRHALDERDAFLAAARRELAARDVSIDPVAVYGELPPADGLTSGTGPTGAGGDGADARRTPEAEADGDPDRDDDGDGDGEHDDAGRDDDAVDEDAQREDAWSRRFSPAGVILRGLVDTRSWITSGAGEELPVLVSGSSVHLARSPVHTAVRLAPADDLRLSGLLWPEARDRLAESAWLTVERVGSGQVVLFAATPAYRGQFRSGGRLFANAVVYGPGVGASQPIDW